MVQPVGFREPSGRPEGRSVLTGNAPLSIRKNEDFSSLLRRPPGPALAPNKDGSELDLHRFEGGRSDHEMPASEELPVGLAPDVESGLRLGSGEAAAWLLLISPTSGEGASAAATTSLVAAAPVRNLEPELTLAAERWLRRLSWAGDGRRGTARLELGAGALAGAELIVTAEGAHISLDLRLPLDVDGGLADRIRGRLEARGYSADVTVR
jgi:hypothetical protein